MPSTIVRWKSHLSGYNPASIERTCCGWVLRMKLMPKTRTTICLAACLAAAISAQAADPHAATKKKAKPAPKPVPRVHLDEAYFAGQLVKFHSVPEPGTRPLLVGPWNLGSRVSPPRSDKRPNLYLVSPGTQHKVEGRPEFDHNEVLSAAPDDPSYFDVYWVVVLDPSVKEDFTSEQQIILATQDTFVLPENFQFDQVPSAGFLKTLLKVTDVDGLEKFHRPDGELPRVAIIPAGFSIKAQAEKPPEETADTPAVK